MNNFLFALLSLQFLIFQKKKNIFMKNQKLQEKKRGESHLLIL